MADLVHHDLPHWRFYLSLEEDLERCFKYIPPEQEHLEVYSEEFAKIILLAASEFENVLKEFKFWSQYTCTENITGYYSCVISKYPRISEMQMVMPRYSIGFTPLGDWSSVQGPDWWSNGYNKIKHDRLSNPKAPTMKRGFRAVGGLQVLLLHYYRFRYGKVVIPWKISPNVVIPWDLDDATHGAFIGWDWKLPDEA